MTRILPAAFPWLLAVAIGAQDPARLDAHRITSGEFRAEAFGPVAWIDGAHYATLEPSPDRTCVELVRYEAVTGAREVLVAQKVLRVVGRDRPLAIESYVLSPDGTKALVFTDSERVWRQNTRGEYFVVDVAGEAAPRRLGGDLPKSSLMFAKWSPKGDRVAFVSGNDLWVEAVADGKRTRLTKDGSKTVINGTFDWVYEEEFDCRDGFRWSPDGSSIAYWQLDCSGVGEFFMVDNLSDRYSRIVPVQYPKAGTTNSSCRIGVVAASGGDTVWMQTPGDPRETYLARMEWHPGGKELLVQWLPRKQNELRVLGCDVATGAVRVVHQEKDEAYVDVRDDFAWLDEGNWFFWTSDTAFSEPGDRRVRQAGRICWDTRGKEVLVTKLALTRGFDVMSVDFADIDKGLLYVRAAPQYATQSGLYRVPLDGTAPQALTVEGVLPRRYAEMVGETKAPGWHEYQISTDGSLAIHTRSAFDMPPVIDLVRLPSHERVRVLVDNTKLRARYDAVAKGQNEFFQVEIEPGVTLDGWVMHPPDFDDAKKWPVVFHVYGEPWSQTVKDTWFLSHHLFHRWLTQQGYVVMSVDARGTPAPKGRDWRKALYQKIGVTSSHDWNLAVTKLCEQFTWMDELRLAIWGWSGGGAMTLNMLFRYPDLFCAGMSVAPVTDISLYDTIYQERYTGDPREVPEVYRECSPITFAKNLKAHLLLVHGTGDDNVHFQHSERLFDELVAHDKQFEYLAYPNRTHAIVEGENTRAHLYAALSDFLKRRVPAGPR
ncbi:MAG: DPP IV N-terminal domain-containing protein [Planctomycetes bacterium]|nr:DPP IV N-terminal domain-containing protein [Planctomycetota bacterium]